MSSRGEIYSISLNSEKRTYFFNIKENRNGDLFLSVVESSKKERGFDRSQIMIYEEDIIPFVQKFNKAASIIMKKAELKQDRNFSKDLSSHD